MALVEVNRDWSVAEGLTSITRDPAGQSAGNPDVIFPPSALAVGPIALNGLRGLAAVLMRTSRQWWERSRQRRHLVTLDDRLLADVGISRATAYEEYQKPFWRS